MARNTPEWSRNRSGVCLRRDDEWRTRIAVLVLQIEGVEIGEQGHPRFTLMHAP